MRNYGNKKKILLEYYKDSSMKKLKFIVDLDYVNQVNIIN